MVSGRTNNTADTVKEPDQDNEIPGCPVDRFRDMSALGMPSSIVPSHEEFDFSQLPSDLVNMWDFSGDTNWMFGNNN